MAWTPIKLRKGGEISFVGESEGGGGGSVPLTVVRFPFAFDTPNLLTGVTVCTLRAGDVFLPYIGPLSISEVWNGTTPQLHYLCDGESVGHVLQVGDNVALDDHADTAIGAKGHLASTAISGDPNTAVVALDATSIEIVVDDGSGGDPGASTGAAVLWLVIVPAP